MVCYCRILRYILTKVLVSLPVLKLCPNAGHFFRQDEKMADNKAVPVSEPEEVDHAASSTEEPEKYRVDLHEYREDEGYVVDAESGTAIETGIKLAPDGHTRLVPQPSDDPNDPLNWSWRKKHIILAIVAFIALLPDYGSATGAVTLLPQSG